jgi:hypothetical protein
VEDHEVREAYEVVFQFEAFVRRNTKLLTSYPKSLLQTALNEPDSSLVAKCVKRQVEEITQPCLQLTQKSQQTQYCLYCIEEEEEIRSSTIIHSIPERGLGPRLICAVGPKIKVYDLNRECVDTEMGCLPDEDWEEVLCVAASQNGRWVAAGYNACIKLWDAQYGTRVLNLQYLGAWPILFDFV